MRGRGYRAINFPIRLQLEFEFLTAAELSNILANYQRMLRAAWRETVHDQHIDKSPAVRLVVSGASSASPLEIVVEYALPAIALGNAIIGPVKDWPAFVKAIFQYVRTVWSAIGKRPDDSSSDRVIITGGSSPRLSIPVSALRDRTTAKEIQNLWSVAQKGRIQVTIKAESQQERLNYKPE